MKPKHWIKQHMQVGCFRYVRFQDWHRLEEIKQDVAKAFDCYLVINKRKRPLEPRWVIHEPGSSGDDPLDLVGSVCMKANDCECLPLHKGWLSMARAYFWLWRHGYARN